MPNKIEITTIPRDFFARLNKYPQQLDAVMRETNQAALLHVWEKVPRYPRRPGSSYVRTGTLGRSMGAGMGGGKMGHPDIYMTQKLGSAMYEGTFGSRLNYAPAVIGEGTQKPIHRGIWWTMKTVANRAVPGIKRIYGIALDKLAKWLDGRSL